MSAILSPYVVMLNSEAVVCDTSRGTFVELVHYAVKDEQGTLRLRAELEYLRAQIVRESVETGKITTDAALAIVLIDEGYLPQCVK
jgi:hypothetical protein